MKSSLESPVLFFEYILNEENIYNELEKRLLYVDSFNVTLPSEISYTEQNEWGGYVTKSMFVADLLIPILRIEFEKSKKLLVENYINYDVDKNKNFIRYQFNIIQSLVSNHIEVLNKYPYFLLPLRGLVKFINERLTIPDINHFIINEDELTYNPVNETENILRSNEDIILSIFEYMKGKNEKGQVILNEQDYQLLLTYITDLVIKEEVPHIVKQLQPKISNDQLRFSFWVLDHELYTTKRKRKYFYDFIKEVFINFKDSEIKSIENQFGTKSRVVKDKFLPDSILKHL
ncbi:hypothetical protein D1632_05350 [Chryseobacterium nematophagum]|uniref:Uncharacterized protein n=1 Tax=Chryseobacterium nematophagum TaxID=2305228 RepID=A0A3M7LE52_9FLAO|nr:hypothetical protein [Chryseobacterium nematophagum]RMZ60365.1 hypothetical protein D1632_05350 [Chryseobacterium nematophagum]